MIFSPLAKTPYRLASKMAGGLFFPTRRVLLQLEFCGEPFCGWQLQSESVESKSKRSIQFYVESAVATILGRNGERFPVQGCGRTDSGVHALDYYAHFDVHQGLESKVHDLQKFVHSLNGVLPKGIVVKNAFDVPLDFHALKSAREKIYEYRVLVRKEAPTFESDFMHWICAEIGAPQGRRKFDLGHFCNAAKQYVGTHDFAAFASSGTEVKNTQRTISKIQIIREKFPHHHSAGDLIKIRYWGDGFLKQMVRNMTGLLFEIAAEKRPVDAVQKIFLDSSSTRQDAGLCAPAKGLFLSHVFYEHPQNPLPQVTPFLESESRIKDTWEFLGER